VPDPASRVRAFYGSLIEVMKQARQLGLRGRYERLKPEIARTFDVPGMTRTATGPGWVAASPAQQASLVEAFAAMMAATYANRFDGFSGENFEVLATVDQPPGKVVKTRIVPSRGDTVELDYMMHNTPEGWKIADVYLDGSISELAIRRGEFGSILRTGGPDALALALRKKSEQLLAGS
jgi:phospholipid transport system substrate-binding protein